MARPKPAGYPKELKTIGDHIRAWRIDNYLLQADIAKMLSVCEDTIVGWETRGIMPTIRQMPRIIKLMGYLPVDLDTSNLGCKITLYRYLHGLTPKEFGTLIPAHGSAVRDWEKGKYFPSRKKWFKVASIINTLPTH